MVTTDQVKQDVIDWVNARYAEDGYSSTFSDFSEAWPEFRDYLGNKGFELASGTVKLSDEYVGVGEGENLWVVFSVGDQFFKVVGYYSSWDGEDWDGADVEEVEPHEVVVIQYRTKE